MAGYILLGGAFTGAMVLLSVTRLEEGKTKRFALWGGLLLLASLLFRLVLGWYSEGFSVDLGTFKAWGQMTLQSGLQNVYDTDKFLDYPPGYLYILATLERLRQAFGWAIEGQTYTLVIKLPSILADVLCGGVLLWLGQKKLGERTALLLSGAYLFCPAVFVNSAQWGQIDSLCTAILLASVLLLYGECYPPSGLLYGLAIICKPQMLVFAPLYLCFAIKQKKWVQLLVGVGCAIGMILLVSTPFTKNFDYLWLIDKYRATMDYYDYYSVNCCNFWALIGWNWKGLPGGGASAFLTVLAPVLATAACCFLMFRSRRKDAVFAAVPVLMGVVYMFAVKMHERYLFPAFLFVLVSFLFTGDRRQLRAYGFLTGANYLNVQYVLWLFREFDTHYDPNAMASKAISLLQAAALGYLLWACWAAYIKGDMKSWIKEAEAVGKGKTKKKTQKKAVKAVLPEEPPVSRAMTRWDWLLMCGITLIYALVGFWRLGGTAMPQTSWTPAEGESVILESEVTCNNLYYLPGLVPDSSHYRARLGSAMRVETSEDGVNWNDCGETKNGHVFAWQTKWLDYPGRYVRLTPLDGSVILNEAGLLPVDAQSVPAVTVQGDGAALVDEPDTVPLYKTYENSSYFDEIYHARTAYEHILGLEPYENTHPPLGKHIIALGIRIFGLNPFGWRFMGALFGVLMLPALYHLCKQLFGRTWLCALGALAFAFDFMHFTQTRIATIDTYSVFFLLLMYDAMVAFWRMDILKEPVKKLLLPLGLSGLFMGLGVASKWTAAYGAVGLAVLYFAKLFAAYRYEVKGRRDPAPVLRRCGVLCAWCCLFFVAIPFGIYFCAFLPMTTLPHNADLVWGTFLNYQQTMFNYHSQLVATHDYASPWYEWPIDKRPIWYFISKPCNSQEQMSNISSMGNPLLWWSFIPAGLMAAALWVKEKRLECGVALTGFLSVYLPWVLVPRLTFIYHYFTAVPFLLLALLACVQWLHTRTAWGQRVLWQKEAVLGRWTVWARPAPLCLGVFALACVALFAAFFPVISGAPTSEAYAKSLAWFPSWYFGT